MKVLVHIFFILLFGLVTFFGLGPVLLADGVWQERLITAGLVLILYLVLAYFYRKAAFKK